jgi:hypothetical protein
MSFLLLFLPALVLLFPNAAGQVIYDLAEINGNVEILGNRSNFSLSDIAVFDFNNNGEPDIFMSGTSTSTPNGIYGLFDRRLHQNQTLDLLTEPFDLWVHGDYGLALGREIIECDVNADGIGDIAVHEFFNDKTVYILYGSEKWVSGTEINLSHETADLTITGTAVTDLGWSMTSTDINDDGHDDLVIGAYNARNPLNWSTGAVFVFFASPEYVSPMTIDLDTDEADISIYGADGADDFGYKVTSGDVNNDGIQDMIVGATKAVYSTDKRGRVYIFFGRQDWPQHHEIDLMQDDADLTIIGPQRACSLGTSVASDDINGDGIDDILIGAHSFDGSSNEMGACYAIHGREDFTSGDVIDLGTQPADITCLGEAQESFLGYGMSAGDLDGDGIAEWVVSSIWDEDDNPGKGYVISGSASYPPQLTIDFSIHQPTISVLSDSSQWIAAYESNLEDLNGDGFDDLILASPDADAPGRSKCGKIHIFFGHTPLDAPPRLLAGPGPHPANPAEVRLYDPFDHNQWLLRFTPYLVQGYGTLVTMADLDGDGYDEMVIGPGPGPYHPSLVTVFDRDGNLTTSFPAYGTMRYGVNLAAGDLDGDGSDEIITGAGPGAVFGPHVRGWRQSGGSVMPMPGVSFMAYGTLRWGVNVATGDLDGDGREEIVTGAGPGDVFGPHVRGWRYNGGAITPLQPVSFLAYGTNQYGVKVACGDIDGDGMAEIVTGPGPSAHFGSHVRGWNYDGAVVSPIQEVSFIAYPGSLGAGGVVVACGDVDNDGNDEILTTPGPLVFNPPWLKTWNYDGDVISLNENKSFMVFGEGLFVAGANVALGNFYEPPDFLP